jgi:hypothetical protein
MCVGGGQGTRGWGGGAVVYFSLFLYGRGSELQQSGGWLLSARTTVVSNIIAVSAVTVRRITSVAVPVTSWQEWGVCVSVGERGRGTRGWGAAIVIV